MLSSNILLSYLSLHSPILAMLVPIDSVLVSMEPYPYLLVSLSLPSFIQDLITSNWGMKSGKCDGVQREWAYRV